MILPAGGVRDDGRRADAEHLGQGEDDEGQIADDADRRDRLGSEPADPVEVDQEVQGLEKHRHEHEAHSRKQVLRERASRQVALHLGVESYATAGLDLRGAGSH